MGFSVNLEAIGDRLVAWVDGWLYLEPTIEDFFNINPFYGAEPRWYTAEEDKVWHNKPCHLCRYRSPGTYQMMAGKRVCWDCSGLRGSKTHEPRKQLTNDSQSIII